jgi:hypothetical protein
MALVKVYVQTPALVQVEPIALSVTYPGVLAEAVPKLAPPLLDVGPVKLSDSEPPFALR